MNEKYNATDADTDQRTNKRHGGRYGSFPQDGGMIVFDRENPDAWITSDVSAQVSEIR